VEIRKGDLVVLKKDCLVDVGSCEDDFVSTARPLEVYTVERVFHSGFVTLKEELTPLLLSSIFRLANPIDVAKWKIKK
jgi:hypothetical protein